MRACRKKFRLHEASDPLGGRLKIAGVAMQPHAQILPDKSRYGR